MAPVKAHHDLIPMQEDATVVTDRTDPLQIARRHCQASTRSHNAIHYYRSNRMGMFVHNRLFQQGECGLHLFFL